MTTDLCWVEECQAGSPFIDPLSAQSHIYMYNWCSCNNTFTICNALWYFYSILFHLQKCTIQDSIDFIAQLVGPEPLGETPPSPQSFMFWVTVHTSDGLAECVLRLTAVLNCLLLSALSCHYLSGSSFHLSPERLQKAHQLCKTTDFPSQFYKQCFREKKKNDLKWKSKSKYALEGCWQFLVR